MGSAVNSRCPRPAGHKKRIRNDESSNGKEENYINSIRVHRKKVAEKSTKTEDEYRNAAYGTRFSRAFSVGFSVEHVRQAMLVVLIIFISFAGAKPTIEKRASDSTVTQAVDYLTKYGYLPRSSLDSGNLRTEDQLQEAIRVMQRFAGVPETGQMDEETVALTRRKRCGMPDLIGRADRVRRYALQGQKWKKNRLTYSVSQGTDRYISLDLVRRQMRKALDVWSEAANLTFTEVTRPDADIVISFRSKYHEDGYPFDGRGSVLAHAFFPGEGIGGDAHFDADELWVSSGVREQPGGDAVNLFSVAAHEFGHSLGLSHSTTQGSLMFPYYQHITDNYKLPYDDTVGIQQLYGPKRPIKWATLPTVTRTPTVHRKPQKPAGRNPNQQPTAPETPDDPREPNTVDDSEEKSIPYNCKTNINAIASIRREIFMFKDRYFWRRDDRGLKTKRPVEIERFWNKLPAELPMVDAVYERKTDSKIVFFTGDKYWLFNANDPEPGYPKSITQLGLPRDLKRLDAAMVWGHNGKTYFFSGNQYWRFDETEGKVEADYPRHMGLWKGVPENMDSAFQHTDGITYFFKGPNFWKFDDKSMTVTKDSPKLIGETWLDCSPLGAPEPLPPYEGMANTNSAIKLSRTHPVWSALVSLLTSALYVRHHFLM